MTQTALLCGCGTTLNAHNGQQAACALSCVRCLRRARLSRENFAGLRELVLRRDDWQCQVCGEVDAAQLVVHHRRPGDHRLTHLITLCRACHVRVHRTWRPGYGFASIAMLRRLWRESNRDLAEQRLLDLLGQRAGMRQSLLRFDY